MFSVPESYGQRLDRQVTQAESRWPVPSCFLCTHYHLTRSNTNWRCQCDQRKNISKQLHCMPEDYWVVAENKAIGCKHWDEVYD